MSNNSNKRAPTTATQRLKQDYLRIKKDPVPYICAEPLPSNILEWHYVVRGPEMTPYEGGYYHGKLIFPREFPFKPPSIYMITPNGRFKCNTRLCLSITDFHPDTWNPAWSVSTILTGLLSFMVEKGPTLGSIETSEFTKRQLAAQSLAFNLKDKVFCELFPEVVEEIKQKQKAQEELSNRPPSLPLPDVVPDGEAHYGQNGIPLLNGHVPLAPANHPGLQQANRNHGLLGGALANLFVIVGFAAFAYTVKPHCKRNPMRFSKCFWVLLKLLVFLWVCHEMAKRSRLDPGWGTWGSLQKATGVAKAEHLAELRCFRLLQKSSGCSNLGFQFPSILKGKDEDLSLRKGKHHP
ncbi:Ube2j2 [Columba livia]|nr:Ube2j2 [Columba livia]